MLWEPLALRSPCCARHPQQQHELTLSWLWSSYIIVTWEHPPQRWRNRSDIPYNISHGSDCTPNGSVPVTVRGGVSDVVEAARTYTHARRSPHGLRAVQRPLLAPANYTLAYLIILSKTIVEEIIQIAELADWTIRVELKMVSAGFRCQCTAED